MLKKIFGATWDIFYKKFMFLEIILIFMLVNPQIADVKDSLLLLTSWFSLEIKVFKSWGF